MKLEVSPVKQLISLPAASQKLTQRNCQLSALKLLLESSSPSSSAPSPTTTIEEEGREGRSNGQFYGEFEQRGTLLPPPDDIATGMVV